MRDRGRPQYRCDVCVGERGEAWKFQADRVDIPAERGQPKQGNLVAATVLREDDIGVTIAREITRVNTEPVRCRRREAVVQAKISRNEVWSAIMIEVGGGEAQPPAPRIAESHRRGDVAETRAVVAKKLQRHPFARGHEVEPAIAVEIDPYRRGDHSAGIHQLRQQLLRHIGEMATVIA